MQCKEDGEKEVEFLFLHFKANICCYYSLRDQDVMHPNATPLSCLCL